MGKPASVIVFILNVDIWYVVRVVLYPRVDFQGIGQL